VGELSRDDLAAVESAADAYVAWRRETDGTWRVAEAIWNTRVPFDALDSSEET
jgi:ketosteroid isomerase-like protein